MSTAQYSRFYFVPFYKDEERTEGRDCPLSCSRSYNQEMGKWNSSPGSFSDLASFLAERISKTVLGN